MVYGYTPIGVYDLNICSILVCIYANSQGGGSKVMSFGKSRAKLHKEDDGNQITFAEVAGLKEEKKKWRKS